MKITILKILPEDSRPGDGRAATHGWEKSSGIFYSWRALKMVKKTEIQIFEAFNREVKLRNKFVKAIKQIKMLPDTQKKKVLAAIGGTITDKTLDSLIKESEELDNRAKETIKEMDLFRNLLKILGHFMDPEYQKRLDASLKNYVPRD